MKKLVSVLLVITVILSLSFCYAADPTSFTGTTTTAFDNIGNAVIGALQVVATIVAIALLLFVGIKFMMAAPGEKANLKGALIPYIVGAIIIFAAGNLVGIVKDFAGNIS